MALSFGVCNVLLGGLCHLREYGLPLLIIIKIFHLVVPKLKYLYLKSTHVKTCLTDGFTGASCNWYQSLGDLGLLSFAISDLSYHISLFPAPAL